MSKIFNSIAFLAIFVFGFSIENSNLEKIEEARSLGYQYKLQSETKEAIECYQTILELDPDDYDARLALGRLYILTENYTQAEDIFQKIIMEDSTDLEAYTGLAEIAKIQSDFAQQIFYLNDILSKAPADISAKYRIDVLYQLALGYQYSDQLFLSNQTLDRIIEIEPTFAEAWAEKGKLAFWDDKPYLAMKFYQKAIDLDPTHHYYQERYQDLLQITKPAFYTKQNFLREQETDLETFNYTHEYMINKRITNLWQAKLGYHSRYTYRDSAGYKSSALYDAAFCNNHWLLNSNHSINSDFRYSFSEQSISLVNITSLNNFKFWKLSIKNQFSLRSELFETWYGVSRQLLQNRLSFSYQNSEFTINYHIGEIDNNYVENRSKMDENRFLDYTMNLNHEIYKNLNFGINYRFQNFQYESDLYYTPQDKKLYGVNASYYFEISDFYSYLSSSLQRDDDGDIETNNSLEFGYNWHNISFALSYANSQTPYYQSDSASVIINGHF